MTKAKTFASIVLLMLNIVCVCLEIVGRINGLS